MHTVDEYIYLAKNANDACDVIENALKDPDLTDEDLMKLIGILEYLQAGITKGKEEFDDDYGDYLDESSKSYQARLRESKSSAINIAPGVIAYCVRNKYDKDLYDLVLEGKKKHTFTVDEWATYREGYPQVWGGPSKLSYFLVTQSGYNAGNGDQQERKTIPDLRCYRYMADHIRDNFSDLIQEL